MAFDLATAKPVAESAPSGGFDLSTARPVQSPTANLLPGEGALRQFAHGASFGFDDELAGAVSALTGGDYQSARDAYARERDAYRVENPKSSFTANLAGGLATSIAAGAGAASALGRTAAGAKAIETLATLSRPAQAAIVGGAAGGAQGAIQGAGDAEGGFLDRLKGAGQGAAIGAAAGAVLGPAASVGGGLVRRLSGAADDAAAPSADALKDAARQAYGEVRDLGIRLEGNAVQNAAQGIRAQLHAEGYRDYLAPKVYRALGELDNAAEQGAVDFNDLDGVRKLLGKAGKDLAESDASRRAIEALDDFAHTLRPEDVIGGDTATANGLLAEARGNWAAGKRAEAIDTARQLAEDQAGSTYTGGNVNNAMRQKLRAILASPAKSRGFSDDELDQMRTVVQGTPAGNFFRYVGKLAPTGPVSFAVSTGSGFATGGPTGAVVVPLVGYGAKALGDASTSRQIGKLATMVAERSPLAAERAASAGPLANLLPASDATIAAMLGQQAGARLPTLLAPQSRSSGL